MNAAPAFPSYLLRGQTRPMGFYEIVDKTYRKIAGDFLVGRRYAESLNPWKRGTANAAPDQPPPTQMPSGPIKPMRSVTVVPAVAPAPSSRGPAPVRGGVGGLFRNVSKRVFMTVMVGGVPTLVSFDGFANRRKEELGLG